MQQHPDDMPITLSMQSMQDLVGDMVAVQLEHQNTQMPNGDN